MLGAHGGVCRAPGGAFGAAGGAEPGGVALAEPPDLRIFFGGEEHGYLQPCGCSKPQQGGFARRATLIARLAKDAGAVVLLERGDFIGTVNAQQKIKLEMVFLMLNEMNCTAATLGENDFRLGLNAVQLVRPSAQFPFVSANVSGTGDLLSRYHVAVVNVRGRDFRLGITAVMDDRARPGLARAVRIEPPVPALRRVLESMKKEADYRIVMCDMGEAGARRLAAECPGIDLIITGRGDDLPAKSLDAVGSTRIAYDGRRGKALGEVQLTVQDGRLVCSGVAVHELGEDIVDSPKITALMAYYEGVLRGEGMLEKTERLPAGEAAFAGASRCIGCHRWQHVLWKNAKHAHALETLETARRAWDPECVVCHTTGFEVQGGFVTTAATPHLGGVGCESCHGAAGRHVESPELPYRRPAERDCLTCHTPDHSPRFVFAEYRPKIDHRRPPVPSHRGYVIFGGAIVAMFAVFAGVQKTVLRSKYRR